jgi:hypothetical protein
LLGLRLRVTRLENHAGHRVGSVRSIDLVAAAAPRGFFRAHFTITDAINASEAVLAF